MSDLPELLVDGDPDDWVERSPLHTPPFPLHDTVRIDGDLPTAIKALRAGDRVTLATECDCCDCSCGPPHPFATATVTEIDTYYADPPRPGWTGKDINVIYLTDVEALQ
jgi:hypothetical protein